jgi:hypothetical protein
MEAYEHSFLQHPTIERKTEMLDHYAKMDGTKTKMDEQYSAIYKNVQPKKYSNADGETTSAVVTESVEIPKANSNYVKIGMIALGLGIIVYLLKNK